VIERAIVCGVPGPRSHVLTTYSGRQLDLDRCTPEAIFIEDVAAALSKICRFGAQARDFYSVAQHALLVQEILVNDLCRPDLSMYGLHHDSHEAFAGDLPSPLKAKLNSEGHGAYERLCDELDGSISRAFGFAIPPKGSADYLMFKRADETALLIEARVLLHDDGLGVQRQLESSGRSLSELATSRLLRPPLRPADAEARFLAAHATAVAATNAV
jgi:hypothetical protein